MIALLLSTLRVATPLLFGALGGLFSERSGVINIALEGLMLVGAFVAAVVTLTTGSPWLGFVAAGIAGSFFAAFYACFVIFFRANQIVAGTALNLLVMGLIPLVLKHLYDSTGATPTLAAEIRFAHFPLWFVWIALLLVWSWLKFTPSGLWVSFAGEHPHALDAAGIKVNRVRFFAVMMSGVLAGLGGASLSIYLSSGYSRNMVAGRGFMALAALIFGKWKPLPTALACLLFAFTEAAQFRLQSMQLAGGFAFPVQLIQVMPYLATIIVLAGFVGRSKPPKAIGTVYISGE